MQCCELSLMSVSSRRWLRSSPSATPMTMTLPAPSSPNYFKRTSMMLTPFSNQSSCKLSYSCISKTYDHNWVQIFHRQPRVDQLEYRTLLLIVAIKSARVDGVISRRKVLPSETLAAATRITATADHYVDVEIFAVERRRIVEIHRS